MPAAVRARIDEARAGAGPAHPWLTNNEGGWGQVSDCFALLRGHPERLPPEEIGWLVGIGMFNDSLNAIAGVMQREKHREPARYILDAFAAGVREGVATQPRQWKGIETILALAGGAPAGPLLDVLPIGLSSDLALPRGVALRLAQLAGSSARPAIDAAIIQARKSANKKSLQRLEKALESLGLAAQPPSESSERDDLLERLLASYGATFDQRLEGPITSIGAAEARKRGPLVASSKGELEGVWLALAAKQDPRDVTRLMDATWPGAWKTARERISTLRRYPPDPRIATAIEAIATRYDSKASAPFHYTAYLLKTEMTRPEPVGRADDALLAEALARAPAVDLSGLWSSFWEDPTAADRRELLTDALLSVADPRGEFIALTSALASGAGDAATERRAASILSANIDAWTGAIPGIDLASRRFRRGFLSDARVATSPEELARSLDVPQWRTVERLWLSIHGVMGDEALACLAKLLGRMPALSTLELRVWGTKEVFAWLERHRFPQVKLLLMHSYHPVQPFAAFPSLRILGSGQPPAIAIEAAVRLNVTGLLLRVTELDEVVELFLASPLEELRLLLGPSRDPFEDRGWSVRLRRGEGVASFSWSGGRYKPQYLGPLFRALTKSGVRKVSIAPPRLGRPELEEELALARKSRRMEVTLDAEPFDVLAFP